MHVGKLAHLSPGCRNLLESAAHFLDSPDIDPCPDELPPTAGVILEEVVDEGDSPPLKEVREENGKELSSLTLRETRSAVTSLSCSPTAFGKMSSFFSSDFQSEDLRKSIQQATEVPSRSLVAATAHVHLEIEDEGPPTKSAAPLSPRSAQLLDWSSGQPTLSRDLMVNRWVRDISNSTRKEEAACDFSPEDLQAAAPGDGKCLTVCAGDQVEVIGDHPSGWVRVRYMQEIQKQSVQDGDLTGWIPESILRASGEIGRGIVTRSVSAKPRGADSELSVTEGTMLKLLGRDDTWWIVEVGGCRGVVPVDCVREATASEAMGLEEFTARLRRAADRVQERTRRGGQGLQKMPSANDIEAATRSTNTAASVRSWGQRAEQRSDGSFPWTYGLWAYLSSYFAAVLCLMFGVVGVLCFLREPAKYPDGLRALSTSYSHISVSLYSIAVGTGVLVFNFLPLCNHHAISSRSDGLKGTCFLILSLPLFASWVTALAGVHVLFVASLFLVSLTRNERGHAPGERMCCCRLQSRTRADDETKSPKSCCRCWRPCWEIKCFRGLQPQVYLIFAWVMTNLALGYFKFKTVRAQLDEPSAATLDLLSHHCWTRGLFEPAESNCRVLLDQYRMWIPIAKALGQGLNLNCSLIVLMVCKKFLAGIYNAALKSKGFIAQLLRKIPVHENVNFHQGLAITIAVQAFGHTFAHYMAHSYTLPTFSRWGHSGKGVTASIWGTGIIMIMCIVVMYPVSRSSVKRICYEMFLYTHIGCATIFMACLLYHAPHFAYWSCVPLGMYLVDRYFRLQMTELTQANLLEVKWRPPVLQLVFDKPWKYRAGQYVLLCCPRIAKYEQHAFTISSAPESGLLCLAIKCWPGGWTEQLRDFLAALCETSGGVTNGFSHRFDDVDWLSGDRVRGITSLTDGTPLLQIDGPHAAPAMRYLEFEVVILAVAGIGLTPASAILRSLLQYRWRSGEVVHPRSIYLCWLCPCAEVSAYQWFADELSDSEVAAAAAEAVHTTDRHCEMHLFVTRAPKPNGPNAVEPPEPQEAKLYGQSDLATSGVQRPYTGEELLTWLQHPATSSNEMAAILAQPRGSRPNEAGHTCVWNGRPEWGAFFQHVKSLHRTKGSVCKAGVFFCGAPAIGKDLQQVCSHHSDKDVAFHLMKETF